MILFHLGSPLKDLRLKHQSINKMGGGGRGGWGKRQRDSGDGSISDRQQLSLFITWTGEASKEEAPEDLPRTDEKRPSPIRPTGELFQQQWWETFWEMGVEHMGFPQWLASILNWTELKWAVPYSVADHRLEGVGQAWQGTTIPCSSSFGLFCRSVNSVG